MVVVTTPAGSTSSEPVPANTLTLSSNAPSTSLAFSPLVGVVLQDTSVQTSTSTPVYAANVGVMLASDTPASSASTPVYANNVGIVFGAVATDIQPKNFAISSSGTLTINGVGLDNTTAVTISPAQGITLGSPISVSANGTQVSLPITVASDAPATIRTVSLNTAAGKIPFGSADASTIGIYPNAVPQFSSISPILGTQGSLLTLTINGQNLQNATAVVATPADGLKFDSQPVINANGTQLTVRIQIAPDAPLVSRVIQVVTPVTSSSPDASPANSFTVYAQ
jgi:hypothetical protein